jgi:hypothetical protein
MVAIKRRELVSGIAAAIATAGRPILGANDRISLGVVGLGGRGTDHLNYYSTFQSDCRIAAVCDVNQSARERGAALVRKLSNYGPAEHTDMRAVFDSKEIDAVSLPLPNHWHALATIWACRAGKDVYVEKPASHNLFEARQMVAAAFCHLANISFRTRRTLRISQTTGKFIDADDANALVSRDYREPYTIPQQV